VPRNSINSDAILARERTRRRSSRTRSTTWTRRNLTTASIGLAASRDVRTSYFVGLRYLTRASTRGERERQRRAA
jgi:hypothetical protein